MQNTQVQTQSPVSTSLNMKKFQVREVETVKTTAAAAYPWWLCTGWPF
ncbi:hypothetical protein [Nostoc sp. TCL26-01]|nr:hypothetical protein [Nostoc sp. TCL26-01]